EQLRHVVPAMLRQDEQVAQPRERRTIGDHARETDDIPLLARRVATRDRREGERVRDRAVEDVAWQALGPVRVLREEAIDRVTMLGTEVADGVVGHAVAQRLTM